MAEDYSDSAQLEAVLRWLHENWKALVSGLVIGLAVVLGWQGWVRHQASHRAEAAHMYADFQQALAGKKNKDVHAIAKSLTADYDNTPYASMAELKLAQADVSHARFKDAAKRLQWVADHGADVGTRSIARLRLAAVLWQDGKAQAALKQLAHPAPAFKGLYAELRGDIALSLKDRSAARAAYHEALAALPAKSVERPTVQHKLADLAGVAASSASGSKTVKSASAKTPAGKSDVAGAN